MNLAFRIFGDLAFRKQRRDNLRRSPVNKALLETWSVALGNLNDMQAEHLIQRRDALNRAFIDLLENDRDFGAAISATTGNVSSVQTRFTRVQNLIVSVWEAGA